MIRAYAVSAFVRFRSVTVTCLPVILFTVKARRRLCMPTFDIAGFVVKVRYLSFEFVARLFASAPAPSSVTVLLSRFNRSMVVLHKSTFAKRYARALLTPAFVRSTDVTNEPSGSMLVLKRKAESQVVTLWGS